MEKAPSTTGDTTTPSGLTDLVDAATTAVVVPPEESKWVINPNTVFMKNWDMYVTLLLVYTATVTPFSVAFGGDNGIDLLWCLDKFVDLGFLIVFIYSTMLLSDLLLGYVH
jgi:hypothetical protein